MNIGTQILKIRNEKGLTQEEFGKIFHVTRQTVSNWENEKSYPDLQILIDISNRFDISLDVLIKEDVKMVKTMDKERVLGSLKREKSVIDFFTGAGTGIYPGAANGRIWHSGQKYPCDRTGFACFYPCKKRAYRNHRRIG